MPRAESPNWLPVKDLVDFLHNGHNTQKTRQLALMRIVKDRRIKSPKTLQDLASGLERGWRKERDGGLMMAMSGLDASILASDEPDDQIV